MTEKTRNLVFPSLIVALWLACVFVGCQEPPKAKVPPKLPDPGQDMAAGHAMATEAHKGFGKTTAATEAFVKKALPAAPPTGTVHDSLIGIWGAMQEQGTLLTLLNASNLRYASALKQLDDQKDAFASEIKAEQAKTAAERKRAEEAEANRDASFRKVFMFGGGGVFLGGIVLAGLGSRKYGGLLAIAGLASTALPIVLFHLIKPFMWITAGFYGACLVVLLIGFIRYVREQSKKGELYKGIAGELAENMQRVKAGLDKEKRLTFFGRNWPFEGEGVLEKVQSPETKSFVKAIKPQLPKLQET
jgi:hypothetical protein